MRTSTLHIVDDDILEKLTQLEASVWGQEAGEKFKKIVQARVELFRKTYRRIIGRHPEWARSHETLALDDPQDDSVLYGYEGWHRYAVLLNGEVWLMTEFCAGQGNERTQTIERAAELGFRTRTPA
ncbi:MAG: hypothetical protein PHO20_05395 [Candidatus Peribacteraceae bacterium]|nr:hypothetical protein [Candidatus Peribacteraceae bacterium]MDD5740171.1 hypothetical protein [Candidatus Peribacteraceae bacterium]